MRKNGTEHIKLTLAEIDTCEHYRGLPFEQKEALISFVYNISIALYHNQRAAE